MARISGAWAAAALAAITAFAGCGFQRPQAPRPAFTRVVHYVPVAPPNATHASGYCWTQSIAAPFRRDAYRCMLGNRIEDPCFHLSGETTVLCGANPASSQAPPPLVMRLTRPLPAPASAAATAAADAHAWLLQLADGRLCRPFTGTLPFAASGEVAHYGCAPATPGGISEDLFGPLHPGRTWTATAASLAPSPPGPPTLRGAHRVTIATVWL